MLGGPVGGCQVPAEPPRLSKSAGLPGQSIQPGLLPAQLLDMLETLETRYPFTGRIWEDLGGSGRIWEDLGEL